VHHLAEESRGSLEIPRRKSLPTLFRRNRLQLFCDESIKAVTNDLSIDRGQAVMHALPQLRTADLRRRGILHQVVQRHTAITTQPGLDILNADTDAVAQTLLRDVARRNLEQVRGGHLYFLTQNLKLIRPRHDGIECRQCRVGQTRMCDPGAVMTRLRLTLFICTHFAHRRIIRRRIALDRDLRGHPTHRMRTAPMTSLDQ